MPTPQAIDVNDVIEQSRFNGFQFRLIALCGLCMILDGFDAQAMSYVAPTLIGSWGIDKAALGPVFGAGMLGMLIGALVFTVVGDRFGRRPVLILATLYFALCMMLTAVAPDLDTLLILRFATGLGLGCIMPNAMALVGEFSPSRARVWRMMLISCGFTLGAALGGVIAALMIPRLGWESVFWLGGVAPLLLAVAMVAWLPESPQFMVLRGRPASQVARWLRTLSPRVALATHFTIREAADSRMPVASLFREGRAGVTLALWAISFMNLINLYFLSNWLPTLMHGAGHDSGTAVLVGSVMQTGGVVGSLSLGWLIGRMGFVRVLTWGFAVAAVFIVLIGQLSHTLPLLAVTVFIVGFCVVGGQPAVNALAASYYPTSLRSTGIGWSLGIGRIGSVVGPVVGGQLIALQWSDGALFTVASFPALASATLAGLLGLWLPAAFRAPSPRQVRRTT